MSTAPKSTSSEDYRNERPSGQSRSQSDRERSQHSGPLSPVESGGDPDGESGAGLEENPKEPSRKDSATSAVGVPEPEYGLRETSDTFDDNEIDMVLVHGIRDTHDTVWKNNGLHRLLMRDKRPRLLEFWYDIKNGEAPIYSVNSIERLGTMLLNELMEYRKNVPTRPLLFISRDVGGQIIKSALIVALGAPRTYNHLGDVAKTLMFVNCMQRCRSDEDAETAMMNLMALPGPLPRIGVLDVVKRLARQVREVNEKFLFTNLLIQDSVCNVVSIHEDAEKDMMYVAPDAIPGFHLAKYEATTQYPYEGIYRTSLSHMDLAKPADDVPDDKLNDLAKWITEFIEDQTEQAIAAEERDPDAEKASAVGRSILLSQCPPSCPPEACGRGDDPLWTWFETNQAYKSWLDVSENGTQILHVNGSSRVPEISWRIFQGIDKSRGQEALYNATYWYQFDRHDSRRNNVRGLFISFLTQFVCRLQAISKRYVDRYVEDMTLSVGSRFEMCALEDLYHAFEAVRTLREVESVYYVISCADQCDESIKWAIERFLDTATYCEASLRIIVTTGDKDSLTGVLHGCPTIELSAFPDAATYELEPTRSVRNRLERLKGQVHPIMDADITTLIDKVVLAPNNDAELGSLVIDWLGAPAQKTATKESILYTLSQIFPATPESVFCAFKDSLSPDLRQLAATTSVLIRTAMRPLTVHELAAALLTDEAEHGSEADFGDLHIVMRKFHQLSPGLFSVRYGEVHFAHMSLSTDESVSGVVDHDRLTRLCLRYLERPEIQNEILSLVDEHQETQRPAFHSRRTWTSYAVLFLAEHYRLATDESLTYAMLEFLEDFSRRQHWESAHCTLSSPWTALSRPDLPILATVASMGLGALVLTIMDREKNSDSLAESIDLAVQEAASHGHVGVVRKLMETHDCDPAALQEALSRGVGYGNSEVLLLLIEEASKVDNFEWPTFLLDRVSRLGLANVVSGLLQAGVDPNPRDVVPGYEYSPLMRCVVGRHEEAAKVLICAGADVQHKCSRRRSGRSAIHLAAAWGLSDIVECLLDKGLGTETESEVQERPLQLACWFSSYRVVEVLLKRGANTAWTSAEGTKIDLLSSATYNGDVKCVALLLEYWNSDVPLVESATIALHRAVSRGRLKIARMLLEKNADPNHTTAQDELPLLTAELRGNVEMVKLLLQYKADVDMEDQTDKRPTTVLASAARVGHKEMFELLLNAGARADHGGGDSEAPLFAAVYNGQVENIRALLEADPPARVDVTVSEPPNWQPIHAAYDSTESLKILLDEGADINAMSGDGTVLYLAARWNFKDTVEALLAWKDKPDLETTLKDDKDPQMDGTTPLCIACRNGHAEIVRVLLEAGANPNHKTRDGSFPLKLCIQHVEDEKAAEEVMRILLEYRPLLDQKDQHGSSALHAIQSFTALATVRALVNLGANLDAVNDDGYTPLLVAVEANNVGVATYLIRKGANPRLSKARPAGSALRVACKTGNLVLVQQLIEARADASEIDELTGESILYASLTRPWNFDVIEYLVKQAKVDVNQEGGRCRYPIIRACLRDVDSRVIKLLIDNGADVNCEDCAGRQPIHIVLTDAFAYAALEQLIEQGADINARDKLGRTTLHYAAALRFDDTINFVLDESKISIDDRDGDEWTPLMWACRQKRSWIFGDIVHILRDHGADPWARAESRGQKWSPLKLARYQGDFRDDDLEELVPVQKTKDETGEQWDEEFHKIPAGWDKESLFCDGCFCDIRGVGWRCLEEPEGVDSYDLCFKCFPRRDILHPEHTYFKGIGKRYKSESGTETPTQSN